VQNNCIPSLKAAHLLSVLHGKAVDILHTVPAEATYDIVESLRGRFCDHRLSPASRLQLKARVQASGGTLHDFAAAVEQLAHRALVELPAAFAQTEVAQSFIHGIRDREVKQHLLLEDDWTLNVASNHTLNSEQPKRKRGLQQNRGSLPRRLLGQVSHLVVDESEDPCAGSVFPPVICPETRREPLEYRDSGTE
jgi:hypothetical protein